MSFVTMKSEVEIWISKREKKPRMSCEERANDREQT